MADVSPIPYRIPMTDPSGLVSRNWQQFFQSLLDRTGGVGDVPSNRELELITTTTDFVDMARSAQLEKRIMGLERLIAVSNGVPRSSGLDRQDNVFEGLSQAMGALLDQQLKRAEVLAILAL